jgi:hypothetical protein
MSAYPDDWRESMRREKASRAVRESVVDNDRDEYRSAARHDTIAARRVGDRWIDVDELPSKDDL